MKIEKAFITNSSVAVLCEDGSGYIHFYEYSPEWEEIQAAIKEHPEVLIPEPVVPPPSDDVLESQAEATRQELFAEYDVKALQYQREVRLGMTGAEARLAAWDAYAEALRAINDTEGWFRDPQWPVKPEV